MQVSMKILRFIPEKDSKAHFETYQVEVEPTDRVLDVLNEVKWKHDGSLAYRRSCAHGICGSDAMRINGKNRLACKTLVGQMGKKIVVEPMMGFRVEKDLIVDMETFMAKVKSVKPYLVNDDAPPARERLQSPEDREKFDAATKCILCGACTTSCPSFWADPNYVGPAAIVQANRFIFDSRDKAAQERLEILGDKEGVWRCRTIFNCVDACPRDIPITKLIGEVKKAILYEKM